MDPAHLEFEINESAAISYETATYEKSARLQALSIRFFLDDFGTGYSFLNSLVHYQFSC